MFGELGRAQRKTPNRRKKTMNADKKAKRLEMIREIFNRKNAIVDFPPIAPKLEDLEEEKTSFFIEQEARFEFESELMQDLVFNGAFDQ